MMLLVFLLLPLALSGCCECSSAFLGARPNHGLAAAAGDSDGLAAADRAAKYKQLVVVVGDRTTRLYHDLWEPSSLSLEHPEDERYLDRHGGRGRPKHKIGMSAGHFSPPQPKAGRSTYPDLISAYFRRLEQEMAAADSVLVMGHGKGKGQAAAVLLNDIARHKPHLKAKIRGLVRLDDTHFSERQVLQLARNLLLGRPDPRKRRIIHGQPLP